MSPISPLREFFGVIAALTNQDNIENFFLIQSLEPTQELLIDLRNENSDKVINEALSS